MNSEVNIEKIMENIRQDIRTRGYTETDVRFADIPIPLSDNGMDTEMFDRAEFQKSLDFINLNWEIPYYFPLGANPVVVCVKRIIRKMIKFLVFPLNLQQNEMNANFVRGINQIRNYIDSEVSIKNQLDNLEYIFNRQVKKDFVRIQTDFSHQTEENTKLSEEIFAIQEQMEALKHENFIQSEKLEILTLKCEKLEKTCEILRGN